MKKKVESKIPVPEPKRNGRHPILICLRSMKLNGKQYPRGSVIDPNIVPTKQLEAMLNSKPAAVRWEQLSPARFYPPPTDLPPPEPPQANPKVMLVYDKSAYESWLLTHASMTRLCGDDAARAKDVLLSVPEGRDLYLRAVRESTTALALKRRVPSVSPDQVFGL